MLMPKKVKYRKQMRGRRRGKAMRGNSVSFGDYGLKILECGWITDKQIEAGRVAMTRFVKRGGKIWVRIFPDKPVTKKPAETRMGKGKGAPEGWVAVVRPGKVIFEMEGVTLHRVSNHNYFNVKKDYIKPHKPFASFSPLNFYEFVASKFGIFPEIETFSIRAFLKLRELLKEHRFDIIHDNQCLGYGFLLINYFGVPLVSTLHHPLSIDRSTWFEYPSTFGLKMKRILYYPLLMQAVVSNRLDRIITVSHDSAREINKAFGVNIMLMSPYAEECSRVVAEEKVPVVTTSTCRAASRGPSCLTMSMISSAVTTTALPERMRALICWIVLAAR